MDLLNLLQHRIRLTARIHVAGQYKHRYVVGCSGGCRRDHVCGAGPYGTGDRDYLLALHLPCKGDSGMSHALLVLALPDLKSVRLLRKSLSQTYHVAVSGKHYHTFNEAVLLSVVGYVLILQKSYQGLSHGQSYGLHALPP